MTPLLVRLRRKLRRLIFGYNSTSENYRVIDATNHPAPFPHGWTAGAVAQRQHQAFQNVLSNMRRGDIRRDFSVLAQAIDHTGLSTPKLLEVGCGSGYYTQVLSHLLHTPFKYNGVDYSLPMVQLAAREYFEYRFIQADAIALPYRESAFDIVINGTALMHILNYEAAIKETARVAAKWCIFHTVPVTQGRETAVLEKRAYGELVVEIIFNESELTRLFTNANLSVENVFQSLDYNLEHVLGEPTKTKTYVCRVGS